MTAVLCARATCRTARHTDGCTDRDCAPHPARPAADGLELCDHHAGRIGPDAVTLGDLYDELEHAIMPGGGGGERVGGRGDDGPPVPRDRVVAVRSEIRHVLVSWCRLIAEERGVALPGTANEPPRRAVERRNPVGGGPGRGEPSCRVLGAYVGRHAEWLAAHRGVAGEVSEELDELRRRAWSVAYPTGTRVVEVGPCPRNVDNEDGYTYTHCTGTLRAIVRPAETLLPSEVVCDADPEHRWSSSEWRQLDRLVSGRRAA